MTAKKPLVTNETIKFSGSTKPTERLFPRPEPEAYIEARRPTVTRVAAGGLLGGPVGALIGLAWRKKTKYKIVK